MNTTKVRVKQDPQEPVAAEIVAKAIIDISDAMKKLSNSGLKRAAIIALVHDSTGLPKRDIILVLTSLEELRTEWCTR